MSTQIIATVDPTRSRIEARNAHNHSVVMDTDPPEGDSSAVGPKEALLAALAGCTGMDVASILRKKQQVARTYEIAISADSAAVHPKVFTAITVVHQVTGAVQAEALRRSIELSATRYCPVNAMLSSVARIEHRYHLTDADGVAYEALVCVVGPDPVLT